MADELISRDALFKAFERAAWYNNADRDEIAEEILLQIPAADAVEVSADELKYLINDTIAYIWRMEDSGRDKSEFGYDERKALLEKLKRFKEEHFPEMRCCGERREENDKSDNHV